MNSSRLILNSVVQRSFVTSTARRAIRPHVGLTSGGSLNSRYRLTQNQSALLFFAIRQLSTETSSPTGGVSGPPPGFNVEEAKKPLKDALNKPRKSDASPLSTAKNEPAVAKEKVDKETSEKKESTELSTANSTAVDGKKAEKKTTIWQKVKHGAQHFWDGTKLLGVEMKISWKLAVKMAAGYELSRRERRQLERTVKDMGRLVPFSVFIIVPAGELFLPIALKLFPNMLPSTYEDQSQKDKKTKQLRATRKDVSAFIKQTLKESGIPVSAKTRQSEEFTQFFKKIRASGETPSREELIKVCKIFKDDVTLDNLSRPQLVGMCRYMTLNTFGTDAMLRYNIRHRMRQIKRDDRAISYEGIDTLSVPELQTACASRGIRTHGVSPARLRDDLATWLELRLKHGLPSTLLVLSNAFMYAQGKDMEIDSHYDAIQAVLSSIPEELYHEIELEIHSAEGAATNKQRLEVLKEQQELIDEENEQREESKETATAAPYYDQDIDEKLVEAPSKDEKVTAPGLEEAKDAITNEKIVQEEQAKA